MGRAAAWTAPGAGALLQSQQTLDLGELSIAILQDGRASHEHVEPEVVAYRHLVSEAAQVPMQFGDLLGELLAPAAELRSAVVRHRRGARCTRPTASSIEDAHAITRSRSHRADSSIPAHSCDLFSAS